MYWTDQFNNPDSLAGYAGIGRELLSQADRPIDVFCGAVSTGTMLVGVSRALRAANSTARIVALEPASCASRHPDRPVGQPHRHVEGTGAAFVPPLLTP